MSVHQDTLSTPYPDPAFDVNRAFEHAGELSAALAASREIPSFFVSGVLAVNAMYTDAKDAGLANSSATERVSDAIRTLEAAVLEAPEDEALQDRIRAEVAELCGRYPLPYATLD